MNRSILGFAVTVLLTATVHTGFAAEATHVPATALAAANADLIARADRALRDYVAACSTGDDEAMARIVTSDAVVEYALKEPGTYLTVDAAALIAKRSVSCRADRNGAHSVEAMDLSDARFERRVRPLHHWLRSWIGDPDPGFRTSGPPRDAR